MLLRRLWLVCLVCLACRPSAAAEPPDVEAQNHLSRAAACLEKGDDAGACAHLGRFLEAQPAHRNARFYHAELLLKLGKHAEAADQFERAVRYEQDEVVPDLGHLVHCHTRLVEIAEALDDDYRAHLHRGIALILLARERARLASAGADGADGAPSAEALLCKATAELSQARALRPGEARACWYLSGAWRQLGQSQPAGRWLAEARRHAPFADLTPAERCDLFLTSRLRQAPERP